MQSLTSEPKLAIILLAAGEGSRLGYYPKALLEKNGIPLIKQFWIEALKLKPCECITVLGSYANQIQSIAQQYSKVVINPNPQQGQTISVRLGLETLQSNYDYLIVALVDQPKVTAVELRLLTDYAATLDDSIDAVVPCYQGQRGNPVLFKRKAIDAILGTSNQSCRDWLDRNTNRVIFFDTNQDGYIRDIDLESDLIKEGVNRPTLKTNE
jgi:CTP:molybdopterin cytidylyltransferase MocA